MKASGDDLIRGLGQLAEAQAWGYDVAVMVTGFSDEAVRDPVGAADHVHAEPSIAFSQLPLGLHAEF